MSNVFEWLPFPVDEAAKDIARKWASHPGQYEYNQGSVIDATMFIPETKRSDETKAQISATGVGNIERWFKTHTSKGNRANFVRCMPTWGRIRWKWTKGPDYQERIFWSVCPPPMRNNLTPLLSNLRSGRPNWVRRLFRRGPLGQHVSKKGRIERYRVNERCNGPCNRNFFVYHSRTRDKQTPRTREGPLSCKDGQF